MPLLISSLQLWLHERWKLASVELRSYRLMLRLLLQLMCMLKLRLLLHLLMWHRRGMSSDSCCSCCARSSRISAPSRISARSLQSLSAGEAAAHLPT